MYLLPFSSESQERGRDERAKGEISPRDFYEREKMGSRPYSYSEERREGATLDERERERSFAFSYCVWACMVPAPWCMCECEFAHEVPPFLSSLHERKGLSHFSCLFPQYDVIPRYSMRQAGGNNKE